MAASDRIEVVQGVAMVAPPVFIDSEKFGVAAAAKGLVPFPPESPCPHH